MSLAINPYDLFTFNFHCFQSGKPLTDAVHLSCSTKMDAKTAFNLFGRMIGAVCERQIPCPICKIKVTSYSPDPAYSKFVAMILKKQADAEVPPKLDLDLEPSSLSKESSEVLPLPPLVQPTTPESPKMGKKKPIILTSPRTETKSAVHEEDDLQFPLD